MAGDAIRGGRWRKVRAIVLERDRHVCHWCAGRATTVDHLVERDAGGAVFDPANLVAACVRCNSERGARYVNAKRARARGARHAWFVLEAEPHDPAAVAVLSPVDPHGGLSSHG
jgi:5-methylcytosine-specific restriction endonuclease McrA